MSRFPFWRRNPALIPHEQHGKWVTTSRRYRWMLLRWALRDWLWTWSRVALAVLVVLAGAACIVLGGYLWHLGERW